MALRHTTVFLATLAMLTLAAPPRVPAAQANRTPVSYICPMPAHSEITEDTPGKCSLCKMTLVPVLIE